MLPAKTNTFGTEVARKDRVFGESESFRKLELMGPDGKYLFVAYAEGADSDVHAVCVFEDQWSFHNDYRVDC